MAVEAYLGNPPANIVDWIKSHSQPAAVPSPYFTYDSNRVITGLYQGSPNVWAEGTYDDGEEEKPYSGWTYGGGSNVVENYATAIGDYAFDDSSYVVTGVPPSIGITGNITFQNITSIGEEAFLGCSGLTSITIPNVTSIGEGAFYSCSGLTSITIPNVTSIGASAFHDCFGLTNVTIGSGIREIGNEAFATQGGNPMTLTIGKTVAEVQAMGQTSSTGVPYSDWGLPSGSTIVCIDDTITI